jgi:hypothetical protein
LGHVSLHMMCHCNFNEKNNKLMILINDLLRFQSALLDWSSKLSLFLQKTKLLEDFTVRTEAYR